MATEPWLLFQKAEYKDYSYLRGDSAESFSEGEKSQTCKLEINRFQP